MWINLRAFLTEGNFGSCLMLLDLTELGPVQLSRCPGKEFGIWMECQRVDGVGQSESVAVVLAVR